MNSEDKTSKDRISLDSQQEVPNLSKLDSSNNTDGQKDQRDSSKGELDSSSINSSPIHKRSTNSIQSQMMVDSDNVPEIASRKSNQSIESTKGISRSVSKNAQKDNKDDDDIESANNFAFEERLREQLTLESDQNTLENKAVLKKSPSSITPKEDESSQKVRDTTQAINRTSESKKVLENYNPKSNMSDTLFPSKQLHRGSSFKLKASGNPEASTEKTIYENSERKQTMEISKVFLNDLRFKMESNEFNIMHWAQLQRKIKNFHQLIQIESQSRQALETELARLNFENHKLKIKLRKLTDQMDKTKKEVAEGDSYDYIHQDGYEILKDTYTFVKMMLFELVENPQIVAKIVEKVDTNKIRILEETLCHTFYENPLSDEAFEHKLLRLLGETLKADFDKTDRNLVIAGTFSDRLISSYLKRSEFGRYGKAILKGPLNKLIQDSTQIILNRKKLQKSVEALEHNTDFSPQFKNSRLLEGISVDNEKDDEELGKHRTIKTHPEKTRKIVIPIFTRIDEGEFDPNKPFPRVSVKPLNRSILSHTETTPQKESLVSSTEKEHTETNEKIELLFMENVLRIKRIVNSFVASIFENIYSMPLGMRILYKIIIKLAIQKFPDLTDEEARRILSNFLLHKWIIPQIISPNLHGILYDMEKADTMDQNFLVVAELVLRVFTQQEYPSDSDKAVFNPYIREFKTSVDSYFLEIININDVLAAAIMSGKYDEKEASPFEARSITISLEEIQFLAENISKLGEEFGESSVIVKSAKNVIYFAKDCHVFEEKKNPKNPERKYKLSEIFVYIYDLSAPPTLNFKYMDEFNKLFTITSTHDKLDPNKQITSQCKFMLKNFLLTTDSIQAIVKFIGRDFSVERIFEFNQDKTFSADMRKKPEMALFLQSCFKKLSSKYREERYRLLYEEISNELKEVMDNINNRIFDSKLYLLEAIDTVRRAIANFQILCRKKNRSLKMTQVRNNLSNIKIPLCLTTPSTRLATLPSNFKLEVSIDSDSILISKQEECFHEIIKASKEFKSNQTFFHKYFSGYLEKYKKGTAHLLTEQNPGHFQTVNE